MQKSLIWISYASLFLLGLADNIRGPLFPEILQTFSLNNSTGSLFFAISSGTIIPAGYIGGLMIKKWGRMRTMRLSLFALFLALLAVGSSPNFSVMLVAVVLFGFSLGTLGVVQNVLVIESAPSQQLQRWQSGLHSMYGLASLTAPILVMWAFKRNPDWRFGFYYVSLFAIVIFILSLMIKDKGINLAISDAHTSSGGVTTKSEKIYFACILGFYVAGEILVGTRVAQLCREVFQFDFAKAAEVNSFFFTMLFIGRAIFIFWQPQWPLKYQLNLSLTVSVISAALGIVWHPYFLILTGFAMAPFYPMMMTIAGKMFSRDLHDVTSLAIALSGITVMLAQLIVGLVGDYYGLTVALFIGPLFSLVALLQIIQYKKIFKRDVG